MRTSPKLDLPRLETPSKTSWEKETRKLIRLEVTSEISRLPKTFTRSCTKPHMSTCLLQSRLIRAIVTLKRKEWSLNRSVSWPVRTKKGMWARGSTSVGQFRTRETTTTSRRRLLRRKGSSICRNCNPLHFAREPSTQKCSTQTSNCSQKNPVFLSANHLPKLKTPKVKNFTTTLLSLRVRASGATTLLSLSSQNIRQTSLPDSWANRRS